MKLGCGLAPEARKGWGLVLEALFGCGDGKNCVLIAARNFFIWRLSRPTAASALGR